MLLSQFDFELPSELIAQTPLEKRDGSKMLALDRVTGQFEDKSFSDFPGFLRNDDILVLNNTKVFPARLKGTTETGAGVESFLVEEISDRVWSVLAKPAKRFKPGKKVFFGDSMTASVLENPGTGRVLLEFDFEGDFDELIDSFGETPLPPYIKREDGAAASDRNRYQTTYAKKRGAIAAPTAGLHFTPDILESIRRLGTTIAEITLHVGYGTFEPVRTEDLNQHRVSAERFEIDVETADVLTKAKRDGNRIVAVGTTTTRALESAVSAKGEFRSGCQVADLTILPGYEFRAVDALLTNFHLPKSSLLVLISAFAGLEPILEAYRHAVSEEYRFYSYGDCMLIS